MNRKRHVSQRHVSKRHVSKRHTVNRRRFVKTAAVFAGGAFCGVHSSRAAAPAKSANEKLNIGCIGVMGKGASDVDGVIHENIVAICDADRQSLEQSNAHVPGAEPYVDYREMLTRDDIDAVTISTPDHHHAPAAAQAIKSGKHVYCQKPLTHSVYEARVLTELAREHGVMTQMGNQGHAEDGTRRSVDLIRAGGLGPVREVHVWTDRPIWPQGIDRPTEQPPVPKHLEWDLWLGPAPERPYHPAYHPFKWRGFWDFGTGALGDMACHNMDIAFWALQLGAPSTIEAQSSGANDETAPNWSIIRYEFPAHGDMPPVTLTWYDGQKLPPSALVGDEKLTTNGSILVGEAATMFVPHYWGDGKIVRGEIIRQPEDHLPKSTGPYQEWLDACRGGPAPLSNFDNSGPLAEMVLLGNVALRSGKKIEWDADGLRIPNAPDAEKYLRREYRSGWSL